jgi:hypothetical protein
MSALLSESGSLSNDSCNETTSCNYWPHILEVPGCELHAVLLQGHLAKQKHLASSSTLMISKAYAKPFELSQRLADNSFPIYYSDYPALKKHMQEIKQAQAESENLLADEVLRTPITPRPPVATSSSFPLEGVGYTPSVNKSEHHSDTDRLQPPNAQMHQCPDTRPAAPLSVPSIVILPAPTENEPPDNAEQLQSNLGILPARPKVTLKVAGLNVPALNENSVRSVG